MVLSYYYYYLQRTETHYNVEHPICDEKMFE